MVDDQISRAIRLDSNARLTRRYECIASSTGTTNMCNIFYRIRKKKPTFSPRVERITRGRGNTFREHDNALRRNGLFNGYVRTNNSVFISITFFFFCGNPRLFYNNNMTLYKSIWTVRAVVGILEVK